MLLLSVYKKIDQIELLISYLYIHYYFVSYAQISDRKQIIFHNKYVRHDHRNPGIRHYPPPPPSPSLAPSPARKVIMHHQLANTPALQMCVHRNNTHLIPIRQFRGKSEVTTSNFCLTTYLTEIKEHVKQPNGMCLFVW